MPKLKALEADYKQEEVKKWIGHKLKHSDTNQAAWANKIGITQQAISYRMKHGLTLRDIWYLDELVGLTDEELIGLCRLNGRRRNT